MSDSLTKAKVVSILAGVGLASYALYSYFRRPSEDEEIEVESDEEQETTSQPKTLESLTTLPPTVPAPKDTVKSPVAQHIVSADSLEENVDLVTATTTTTTAAATTTTPARTPSPNTDSPVQTCANCGKTGTGMLRCAKCKTVRYCGAKCQRSHWKVHKRQCLQLAAGLKQLSSSGPLPTIQPIGEEKQKDDRALGLDIITASEKADELKNQGNFVESIKYWDEALHKADLMKNHEASMPIRCSLLNQRSICQSASSQWQAALRSATEAYQIANFLKDTELQSEALINKATALASMDDLNSVQRAVDELSVFTPTNEAFATLTIRRRQAVCDLMTNAYLTLGKFEEALSWANVHVGIAQDMAFDKTNLEVAKRNLSLVQDKMKTTQAVKPVDSQQQQQQQEVQQEQDYEDADLVLYYLAMRP